MVRLVSARVLVAIATVLALLGVVLVVVPGAVRDASAQACGGLAQEAEDGAISGSSFEVAADNSASGGEFVWAVPGTYGRPYPSDEFVEFCVDVPVAGEYVIDAQVLAQSRLDDSFYVTVDGVQVLWDLEQSQSWIGDQVRNRGVNAPAVWALDAGQTTVRFYQREDGTKLDRFELARVSAGGVALGLSPISRQVDVVGEPVFVVVAGDGLDGATFSASGLPAGVAVDAATGALSGTPTAAGTSQVTVTATSADGADSSSFEWVVVGGAAAGGPAIESYTGFPTARGTYVMGYRFRVDSEMSVAELGALDANGNGRLDNRGGTPVGLWTDNGTLLGQVTVPDGAAVEGGFAYADLSSPVTLSPGQTYRVAAVVAQEPFAYSGNLVQADYLTIVDGTYRASSSLVFPALTDSYSPYLGGTFRAAGSGASIAAPVVDEMADQVSELNASTSLQVNATGAQGLALTYGASGLPAGLSINSATGVISGTPTVEQTATVVVTVTDELDATSFDSFEWLVLDGNPPVMQPVGRQVDETGVAVSIPVVLSEGAATAYTAANLPPGVQINANTGVLSGTPTAAGVYQVTVTASDQLGLEDSTSFEWVIVGGSGGGVGGAAIESYTGFPTARGSYVMGYRFRVDSEVSVAELGALDANRNGRLDNSGGTPVGLWTDNGTLLGQVTVPASAAVEGGFAYADLSSPVTLSPGQTYRVAAVVAQEPYAYNGNMVQADYLTVVDGTYRAGSSLAFPTSTDSYSSYLGGTFRAAAGGGNVAAPVVGAIGDRVHKIGDSVSATVNATGAAGLVLTYSASGLPAGVSIDRSTGVISGTTTTEQATTVVVTVTDELGKSGTVNFEWQVLDDTPPVVSAIAGRSDSAFSPVSIRATIAGGGSASWSASGLPAGVAIDSDTGVISGAATSAGTYNVTVTATDPVDLSSTTSFVWTVTEPEGVVALFADVDQGGASQFFPVGRFAGSDLNVVGNDRASSIRVAPGFIALVCTDGNGGGTCRAFGNPKNDLREFGLGDNISYLQVQASGEALRLLPGSDVGQIVNVMPDGSEFTLAAGVHSGHRIFPKLNNVFNCESGAILDGAGGTFPAFNGTRAGADNVEIRGCEIRNYQNGAFVGAINGRNTGNFSQEGKNWIVENNKIYDNAGPGVNVASGMRVLNNEIYNNAQIGVSGLGSEAYYVEDVLIEGNNVHDNNFGPIYATGNPFHEGGIKLTYARDYVIRDNDVHANQGFGIHVDLYAVDGLIEDNRVYNISNTRQWIAHIYVELLSNRVTVRNNVVTTSLADLTLTFGLHGITVGGSNNTVVEGNTVLGGSTIVEQDFLLGVLFYDTDNGGYGNNNVFRNNTVNLRQGGGYIGYSNGTGNQFTNNSYIGSPGFLAGGSNLAWGGWQRSGQDAGGSYS